MQSYDLNCVSVKFCTYILHIFMDGPLPKYKPEINHYQANRKRNSCVDKFWATKGFVSEFNVIRIDLQNQEHAFVNPQNKYEITGDTNLACLRTKLCAFAADSLVHHLIGTIFNCP